MGETKSVICHLSFKSKVPLGRAQAVKKQYCWTNKAMYVHLSSPEGPRGTLARLSCSVRGRTGDEPCASPHCRPRAPQRGMVSGPRQPCCLLSPRLTASVPLGAGGRAGGGLRLGGGSAAWTDPRWVRARVHPPPGAAGRAPPHRAAPQPGPSVTAAATELVAASLMSEWLRVHFPPLHWFSRPLLEKPHQILTKATLQCAR